MLLQQGTTPISSYFVCVGEEETVGSPPYSGWKQNEVWVSGHLHQWKPAARNEGQNWQQWCNSTTDIQWGEVLWGKKHPSMVESYEHEIRLKAHLHKHLIVAHQMPNLERDAILHTRWQILSRSGALSMPSCPSALPDPNSFHSNAVDLRDRSMCLCLESV